MGPSGALVAQRATWLHACSSEQNMDPMEPLLRYGGRCGLSLDRRESVTTLRHCVVKFVHPEFVVERGVPVFVFERGFK